MKKSFNMKNIFLTAIVILSIFSCKKEEKVYTKDLPGKLEELKDLKANQLELIGKITAVEADLLKLDPSRAIKPKLVSTMQLATEGFEHYINLQGLIKNENISYVAPRNGMGGYVKNVYVKAGQSVKKGQLLLKLDDSILRQGIESIRTQLKFAQSIYDKNKALWDQGIGTEVQLLGAKNNVDGLLSQIAVQEEQLKTFNVYADQTGIAEIVNIRAGEMFTGMSVLGPQIQIINNGSLNVNVDVPENYVSRIKVGSKVVVEVPSMNKKFNSTVKKISQSINPGSRGFTAECAVPAGLALKPNMGASINILNHANTKAIVIPVNVIQSDEKSKYVYVMENGANGKKVTKKKNISVGEIYGDDIEVLSGLGSGDRIIIQGFQNLYEGQLIDEVK
jgi:membrane fusion protein, multidrug efflux system